MYFASIDCVHLQKQVKDEVAREGEQEEQLPAEEMCILDGWRSQQNILVPLMSTPAAVLLRVVWMQEEEQRQEQEQD